MEHQDLGTIEGVSLWAQRYLVCYPRPVDWRLRLATWSVSAKAYAHGDEAQSTGQAYG